MDLTINYNTMNNSSGEKGLTIFFDLKVSREALLWVAVELGHHFPDSRTTHTHTHTHTQTHMQEHACQ